MLAPADEVPQVTHESHRPSKGAKLLLLREGEKHQVYLDSGSIDEQHVCVSVCTRACVCTRVQ